MNRLKHSLLKKCCKNWSEYMAGKMGVENFGTDCSCDCYFFLWLAECGDWGVCCNPESPRAGLLTWEHQGCEGHFKKEK